MRVMFLINENYLERYYLQINEQELKHNKSKAKRVLWLVSYPSTIRPLLQAKKLS